MLSNQEVVDIVEKNKDMSTCCDIITMMARRKGSDDNITVMCILL